MADDLEQVLGPKPLEPERCALRRVGTGHQQRPAGILAKTEAEQGAIPQLFADQLLRAFRRETVEQVQGRLIILRQANQDPVIAVQAGDDDAQPLPQAALKGELQGLVKLAAERSEHGHSHLAGRVAERLDNDGLVVGGGPDDSDLSRDVIAQRLRRRWLEMTVGLKPGDEPRVVEPVDQLAAQGAHGFAELGGPR